MPKRRGIFTFLFTILASFANAVEISQALYEDLTGAKCTEASMTELSSLQCKFNVSPLAKSTSNTQKELDQAIENTVFKKLAENKVMELECSSKMIQQIRNDAQLTEKFVTQTCLQLEPLLLFWKRSEYLQSEIESYSKINDRSLRPVPEDEFQNNLKTIEDLKRRKAIYDRDAKAIVGMDTLLSSPQVLEKIRSASKSSIFSKTKTHDDVCKILHKDLGDLLDKEQTAISKKTESIKNFAMEPNGFFQIFVKKELWTRGGRETLQREFGKSLDTSTMCRMEGRYGKGLEHTERMGTIASLGLSAASFMTGRALTAGAIRGLGGAETILAALTVAEFGVGTAISVAQTVQTCSNRFALAPTGKFCSAMTSKELATHLTMGAEAETALVPPF